MDLRGLSRIAWLGAVFPMLSVSVVSGDRFAGGDGTAVSPYQIASAEQLVALGSDPNLLDRHFVLIRDLNTARIEPNTVRPIGDSEVEAFTGVFDGQGHVISHLRIVRPLLDTPCRRATSNIAFLLRSDLAGLQFASGRSVAYLEGRTICVENV